MLSLPTYADISNNDPRELEMELDFSDGDRPPQGWVEGLPQDPREADDGTGSVHTGGTGGTGGSGGTGAAGSYVTSNTFVTAVEQAGYMGAWPGPLKENAHKSTHFLPNHDFPSNHLPLLVEFTFLSELGKGRVRDWRLTDALPPSSEPGLGSKWH